MKLVYAGANALSVLPLQALRDAGFNVVAAVTQPDRPVGRKAVLTPCPLKVYAQAAGIEVLDFPKIREHVAQLQALGADCMVTCSYGQILTRAVLDCFAQGVYNIHTSLLPRWRGASPIQHSILAGDERTGVTIMRTDVGLDTGDILLQRAIAIGEEDAAALAERLFRLGADCITQALRQVEAGTAVFTRQDDSAATVCKKIGKADCEIDFSAPAESVCRLIRAMNPEPLAFTFLRGKTVNVYAATAEPIDAKDPGRVVRADKTGIYVAAGIGSVRIAFLQEEGGKRLRAADFVNGRKVAVGDRFGRRE